MKMPHIIESKCYTFKLFLSCS